MTTILRGAGVLAPKRTKRGTRPVSGRQIAYAEVEKRWLAAAAEVSEAVTAEFERLRAANDPRMAAPALGFSAPGGLLKPGNQPWPIAPIKYVNETRLHTRHYPDVLPFFAGVRSVFEIGVGAGFLLALLRDVHGARVSGVDIEVGENGVYDRMRAELGLTDAVSRYKVTSPAPIPIPEKTEAVAAFNPVFNLDWTPKDYDSFHAECQRHGVSRVFWFFNRGQLNPDIRGHLHGVGRFPITNIWPQFCVVVL
jgi:hypothetical protein